MKSLPNHRNAIQDFLDRIPETLELPPQAARWPKRIEAPFPVEVPFEVRPDLGKLGAAPMWQQDHQWPSWIARKRGLMASGHLPLLAPGVGDADLQAWQSLIQQSLSGEDGPLSNQGRWVWLGGRTPQSAIEFFCLLTLSVQEDFAIMVSDGQGGLHASLLSVAFPSGWRPEEKVGRSMQEIHQPVADNAALQRASPAMAAAMLHKGPFIRYVWTLAGSDALGRAPEQDTLAHAKSVGDLWFRCERQITVPLAGQACLFLIRVFVEPLPQVLSRPGRSDALVQSLASMTQTIINYKGIARARQIVLDTYA